MTEELIKQKAENVYVRCFDDDFIYPGVLLALEICAEEVATEATKELEAQIEKMKCCEICNHNKGGCSYHHNWTNDCLENNHKYFELRR